MTHDTPPGTAGPDGPDLREALKAAGVALKRAGVPFALCGGFAAWVRGAPEPSHDVDFVVTPGHADAAREALADAGFDVVQPPEDWLFKAFRGEAMVDVILRLSGGEVTERDLARADDLDVLSVRLPVLSATDLVVSRLTPLSEHYCDLGPQLEVARALREQVDWDEVADRTAANPFARAFLFLLGELDVAGRAPARSDRSATTRTAESSGSVASTASMPARTPDVR
ncbi:nucleotidyltransferase family protein [Luteimicrobium sp. DT211]|uniref:nucleotidyltransferase family protein n=1 Tax=Luteimicrobium sp. DT211 TaxID=3393412 RepID=UPI003CFB81FE